LSNRMETSRRRITVSKDGIAEHSVETQIRPATRAKSEGAPNFSHFRGADNPNWAFGQSGSSSGATTQQHEKQKSDTNKLAAKLSPKDAANFSATLTSRLKEIDAVADEMVAKVESMKKEMISRKEMDELTDNFNGPNRLRIVTQVKREIRKNKRILLENRELRQCLAEHQTVLEMVMGKFRRVSAHAARLERENSSMVGKNGLTELKAENQRLTERVGEMLSLMSFAVSHNNERTQKWIDLNRKIERLQTENNNLRQLLYLSKGFGSYQAAKVPYIEMDSAKSAQTVLNNNNVKEQTEKLDESFDSDDEDEQEATDCLDFLNGEGDSDDNSDEDDDNEFEPFNGANNELGDMNIITSLIQSSLKLKTEQVPEDSDISDVESTASTVVNEAAYTEADDDMFVAQSFNGS